MVNKRSKKLIFLIIAVVILLGGVVAFNFSKTGHILGIGTNVDNNLPVNLDILGKLKLSYSDRWEVTNNGTEGVELFKDNTTILLTTSKIENNKTLDEIVDSRKEVLKSTKKITSDSKLTINSIVFRRLELGSLDETLFPSDGFISYSAVVNTNIYLTLIINFPAGGNPKEAESIINTIRYN